MAVCDCMTAAVWRRQMKLLTGFCKTSSNKQITDNGWSDECAAAKEGGGGSNCGVSAVAISTSLVLGQCSTLWSYTQKACVKASLGLPGEQKRLRHSPPVNRKYHHACNLIICKCCPIENGKKVQCDGFQEWFHVECVGMDSDSVFLPHSVPWLCTLVIQYHTVVNYLLPLLSKHFQWNHHSENSKMWM